MDNLQQYMLKFPYSFSIKEHLHYFPEDVRLPLLYNNSLFQELEAELDHKTEQYIEQSVRANDFAVIINKFIEQEQEIKQFRENLLNILIDFKLNEVDINSFTLNDIIEGCP